MSKALHSHVTLVTVVTYPPNFPGLKQGQMPNGRRTGGMVVPPALRARTGWLSQTRDAANFGPGVSVSSGPFHSGPVWAQNLAVLQIDVLRREFCKPGGTQITDTSGIRTREPPNVHPSAIQMLRQSHVCI